MIDEGPHRLVEVRDAVILEGVVCEGRCSLRGGCPRRSFLLWHEIWLERMESGGVHARSTGAAFETA
jgi:hypothetical protein